MTLETTQPAVLNVRQLSKYLNISESIAYQLVRSEGFPTLRLGKRIVVPVALLDEWIRDKATKSFNSEHEIKWKG